jgi:hypothetical protein
MAEMTSNSCKSAFLCELGGRSLRPQRSKALTAELAEIRGLRREKLTGVKYVGSRNADQGHPQLIVCLGPLPPPAHGACCGP